MPELSQTSTLQIFANRGGTIQEISGFLADLEAAYISLYQLDQYLPFSERRLGTVLTPNVSFELLPPPLFKAVITPDAVLPDRRLTVTRVQIESPGFWEVMGSLSPLQQLREYLNDRHRRRQDRDFREAAESERLRLDNELIQRQIWEKENAILRERILMWKEIGYTDEEIRQLVWALVGKPLAMLGRHQDSRLIEGAAASGVRSAA
jgi:hypothetical protein